MSNGSTRNLPEPLDPGLDHVPLVDDIIHRTAHVEVVEGGLGDVEFQEEADAELEEPDDLVLTGSLEALHILGADAQLVDLAGLEGGGGGGGLGHDAEGELVDVRRAVVDEGWPPLV